MNRAAAAVNPPPLELRFDNNVPVLVLDETAAIDALRASIRAHMPGHAAVIAGRSTRIDLGTREVTLFDLRRVIHMLKQEYGVEITGLYLKSGAVHRFAERELKLKLFTTDGAPPTPRAPMPVAERPVRAPKVVAELPEGLEEVDTEEVDADAIADDAELSDLIPASVISEPTAELERLERLTLPHDIQANDLVDAPQAAVQSLSSGGPPHAPVHAGRGASPFAAEPEGAPPATTGTPVPVGPPQHVPGAANLVGADGAEGRATATLHRTLRSGAVVRFDGDLYVFGDVNPGAQIVATGNIVVLGALKGVAHAGAAGDESAFILAFDLRPTQLRIARKIAVPPARKSNAPPPPEVASVSEGQITIEAYRGRIRP